MITIDNGTVTDKVTDESFSTDRNVLLEYAKERMFNDANAVVVVSLSPICFLEDLFMGKKLSTPNPPFPEANSVWVGPYGPYDRGLFDNSFTNDAPGIITGIDIREYNSIDALKFYYETYEGKLVGNPNGGELHQIRNLNKDKKAIISVDFDFNNTSTVAIGFNFSDGSSTGMLGNRRGWSVFRRSCGLDGKNTGFIMTNVQMALGHGPSFTSGPIYFKLFFQFL
jgi:hypothetical protein